MSLSISSVSSALYSTASPASGSSSSASLTLSEEEQRVVEQLKVTDRKVRAHEQAHVAAGGSLVRGAATYGYKQGPDGKLYAVSGEVSIDTSPEKKPDDTIRKGERVRAAALAPADPSSQDRSVAAAASRMISQAQIEKIQQTAEEQASGSSESSGSPDGSGNAGNTADTTFSAIRQAAAATYRSAVQNTQPAPSSIQVSA